MSQEILLADPSPLMRRIAAGVLERGQALRVTSFPSGQAALGHAAKHRPAVVLASDQLPDLSAEEFCRRLRSQESDGHVPLAMLCRPHASTRDFKGVQAVLKKPFHPDILAETVAGLLNPVVRFTMQQQTQDLLARGFSIKTRSALQASTREFSLATSTVEIAGNTRLCPLPALFADLEGDLATGVLIVFTRRFPVEVWFSRGRILLCTTRDLALYCKNSPAKIPESVAVRLEAAREIQRRNACPIFLSLLHNNCLLSADAVNYCRDHGQRLFSGLWAEEWLGYEFESHGQLPGFLEGYPAQPETAVAWLLRTLRYFNDVEATLLNAGDFVVATPEDIPHPAHLLRLNPVETLFFNACRKPGTVEAAGLQAGMDLSGAKLMAHRLFCIGLLRQTEPESHEPSEVDESKIVSFSE